MLLEGGLYRDSINRFYYASFYAVLALLCLRGLGTSKHSGAISLFDREFVKSGVFGKELSMLLHKSFDMRQEADYAELVDISGNDAQQAHCGAARFVACVDDYIRNLPSGDENRT